MEVMALALQFVIPDHKAVWVLGSGKDNLSGDQKQ